MLIIYFFIGQIDGKEKDEADTLLGSLDTTYLLSYAIFMFPSGMIADRLDLRYFLAGGMIGSGIITILFGVGKYLNIHSLIYFIFIQVPTTTSKYHMIYHENEFRLNYKNKSML